MFSEFREIHAPTSDMHIVSVSNSDSSDTNVDAENKAKAEVQKTFDKLLKKHSSHCMNYFPSATAATIVEEAMYALKILADGNAVVAMKQVLAKFSDLREMKFSIAPCPLTVQRKKKDITDKDVLLKMDSDLTFIRNSLAAIYIDLSLNMSYKTLDNIVDNLVAKEVHREQIACDYARNKVLCNDLHKQHSLLKRRHKREFQEKQARINALLLEVADAEEQSAIEYRYVNNWESSRTEQLQLMDKKLEDSVVNSRASYANRLVSEDRIHCEVDHWSNIVYQERMAHIEKIMAKYDTDTEAIALKLKHKYNDFNDLQEYRISLEDKYMKRNKEMFAWNKFKADREMQREYVRKMTASAIIVQAWWRGLLCRKQMGPYRPRKHRRR